MVRTWSHISFEMSLKQMSNALYYQPTQANITTRVSERSKRWRILLWFFFESHESHERNWRLHDITLQWNDSAGAFCRKLLEMTNSSEEGVEAYGDMLSAGWWCVSWDMKVVATSSSNSMKGLSSRVIAIARNNLFEWKDWIIWEMNTSDIWRSEPRKSSKLIFPWKLTK